MRLQHVLRSLFGNEGEGEIARLARDFGFTVATFPPPRQPPAGLSATGFCNSSAHVAHVSPMRIQCE